METPTQTEVESNVAPVLTNTEILALLGDFVGGKDTQDKIQAKRDAQGGYISIPVGQPVEVIPLTNFLATETIADLTDEERQSLQNPTDIEDYVPVLQKSLRNTVFYANTVSLFLDASDVEAHNKLVGEGSSNRIGKAIKFRMSGDFNTRQASALQESDPVAWLIARHEELLDKNAFRVRITYNFGKKISSSNRAFMVVRNTDGAEQLLEMSQNQLSELRPMIEAITGIPTLGAKWRGGKWMISKSKDNKYSAKFLSMAEPEDEDDDFYPHFVDMTHRGFGTPTSDITTRTRLITNLIKPEYFASLTVKPAWYTSHAEVSSVDFD